MNNQITLKKMTLAEKINLMEELSEDLSTSSNYTPPEWHGEELARRKNAVSEGDDSYTHWRHAKDEIRKEVS